MRDAAHRERADRGAAEPDPEHRAQVEEREAQRGRSPRCGRGRGLLAPALREPEERRQEVHAVEVERLPAQFTSRSTGPSPSRICCQRAARVSGRERSQAYARLRSGCSRTISSRSPARGSTRLKRNSELLLPRLWISAPPIAPAAPVISAWRGRKGAGSSLCGPWRGLRGGQGTCAARSRAGRFASLGSGRLRGRPGELSYPPGPRRSGSAERIRSGVLLGAAHGVADRRGRDRGRDADARHHGAAGVALALPVGGAGRAVGQRR